MNAFHSILGVKHQDISRSAPDNPTQYHHAVVERRNKVMEKMLDVAASKADLNSFEDLDMYFAVASAACNLEYDIVYNGHTVLEY